VQARMGASRLPGKPLMEVEGKPLLAYLVERLQRVKNADKVIVATTEQPQDDAIASAAQKLGAEVFRGSERDVLDRYARAAETFQADVIVRVTGDCPLIDPAIIDQAIEYFIHHYPKVQYVSNTLERTYPRGMDVEVFSRNALDAADREGHAPEEREHVTVFIYRHSDRFPTATIKLPENLSQYRWTVDTPEDFYLVQTLLREIVPQKENFTLKDLVELINLHPEWNEINAHVQQKVL
jgi:spore coat polysaccharide biosynthesis protein SpsF